MTTLIRHRTARFVVGTAAVGSLADWTLFAAMVATVDVLLGGGPWAVAAVIVARLLPGVAFAPLAARRADRGDLDTCLLRHEALRVGAVATVALAAATRSVPLALAGVIGFEYGAAMLAAARESLISRHVPRAVFTPVNTATAVLSYGSLPLGALLVAATSPALAFGSALVGYGALTLAYALGRPTRAAGGVPTDVRDAVATVPSSTTGASAGTPWRTVAAAALGLMPAVGLFAVAPGLAELWVGDRAATGSLYAFVIAGGAAGFAAANLRPSLPAAVPLCVAALGTAVAAGGRWQVGLTLLGAGAGAAYLALQNRLQHEATDPSQFARAFAILKVATGVAVVGAPALASLLSLSTALALLALLPVLAAAVTVGTPGTLVRLVVRESIGLLLRAVVEVRVEGADRRVDGPCVVVSNHPHVLDGPVAVAADRSLRPVARWQRNPGARFVIWAGGSVVTTAGTGRDPRPAYEQAADHLRAGGRIWLAPEGGSHQAPALRAPRSGAVRMAHAAGVPIQPLAIRWEDDLAGPDLRRWRPWARRRVTVRWGDPLRTTGSVEADGHRMMNALADVTGLPYEPVEHALAGIA
ncbi:MAG: 1-acyl-sn-glycerol-3-phosphate acyltransferase [Actinobacteria bacterium]|nr:1-acyl-sn-glycerol-3-phosphate acyltransferase [Actinomycetota bacterium]